MMEWSVPIFEVIHLSRLRLELHWCEGTIIKYPKGCLKSMEADTHTNTRWVPAAHHMFGTDSNSTHRTTVGHDTDFYSFSLGLVNKV